MLTRTHLGDASVRPRCHGRPAMRRKRCSRWARAGRKEPSNNDQRHLRGARGRTNVLDWHAVKPAAPPFSVDPAAIHLRDDADLTGLDDQVEHWSGDVLDPVARLIRHAIRLGGRCRTRQRPLMLDRRRLQLASNPCSDRADAPPDTAHSVFAFSVPLMQQAMAKVDDAPRGDHQDVFAYAELPCRPAPICSFPSGPVTAETRLPWARTVGR